MIFIDRCRKVNPKGAIMSVTSTSLNTQALADLVPVDKRRDIVDVCEKTKLKGVSYVKKRTYDYEMEVEKIIKRGSNNFISIAI